MISEINQGKQPCANLDGSGKAELIIRQSPTRAVEFPLNSNNNSRKVLEPATIVEVTHLDTNNIKSSVLFGAAVLLAGNAHEEINYIPDTNIRITYGLTTSGLHLMEDPENNFEIHAFLVFPNLSVRVAGKYQLKVVLYILERYRHSKQIGFVSDSKREINNRKVKKILDNSDSDGSKIEKKRRKVNKWSSAKSEEPIVSGQSVASTKCEESCNVSISSQIGESYKDHNEPDIKANPSEQPLNSTAGSYPYKSYYGSYGHYYPAPDRHSEQYYHNYYHYYPEYYPPWRHGVYYGE
ncbi:hypothetical protein HK103_005930 [Boothiomyces macroporosus]|uniref:Velvet domain-containing protein n=1 Tax=Boothiomyces macroporosus TaxID=261099 RepID=A0AAD5ULC2_9FUNG|nr:hypothetical protein HK103_005930 [Boothiomyces macroporosus]